jgi:hypothetical protein
MVERLPRPEDVSTRERLLSEVRLEIPASGVSWSAYAMRRVESTPQPLRILDAAA